MDSEVDSCEIGTSSVDGEIDSSEPIVAEAALESTVPTLSWPVGLRSTAGLAKPVICEHHCSAARMRTCSRPVFSNHSASVISLEPSIGSSLWKPPHLKNSLANGMFALVDLSVLRNVWNSLAMIRCFSGY